MIHRMLLYLKVVNKRGGYSYEAVITDTFAYLLVYDTIVKTERLFWLHAPQTTQE